MNDQYYELESILNDLPQRSVAIKLQQIYYNLVHQEKMNQPILEVEKYFRNLIRKIEQFYCRRLQKLDYFISKKIDQNQILLRISKYQLKKPWRLDSMDYTAKKEKKKIDDDKNCNQFIKLEQNNDNYQSSKTSTPFSHYSQIPSIPTNLSLNQAVFLDFVDGNLSQTSLSLNDQESINISYIQQQLEQLIENNINNNTTENIKQEKDILISDLNDSDLEFKPPSVQNSHITLNFNESDIKSRSDFDQKITTQRSKKEFNSKFEQKQMNTPISPSQQLQPREFQSLFQTQQSTKEIIKYVEQYHQQQETNQKTKPLLEENIYYCQDKNCSPSLYKRYRVRSSYQKELPNYSKQKINVSHDNFEVRTAKSNQTKKKPFQLPSPLNDQLNQQKNKPQYSVKAQKQQQQPQLISAALSRQYKKFSQIKQSSSVVTKRSTKQTISYSLEKDAKKWPKSICDYY